MWSTTRALLQVKSAQSAFTALSTFLAKMLKRRLPSWGTGAPLRGRDSKHPFLDHTLSPRVRLIRSGCLLMFTARPTSAFHLQSQQLGTGVDPVTRTSRAAHVPHQSLGLAHHASGQQSSTSSSCKVTLLSCIQLFVTPRTTQAMGFSGPEYQSG